MGMRPRARSSVRRTGALSLFFALIAGCEGPAAWRYEDAVEKAPPSAAHAVHESRIQAIMRDIERLREERLPKAFELEQGEEGRAKELARVARAMAESAARIREAEPRGLESAERREFLALAGRLEERAGALADDARTLTPEQRGARLSEIDALCHACHARFRIPKGDPSER
jgi:cytochrome c556